MKMNIIRSVRKNLKKKYNGELLLHTLKAVSSIGTLFSVKLYFVNSPRSVGRI